MEGCVMAGDWIKWCVGLVNKPEIIRAASEANMDRHEVAGRFLVFCEWADANIPEDQISDSGMTYVNLSPSDEYNRAFVGALLGSEMLADSFAANWIRYRNGRVELPNFSRHNGLTAKTRARNSKSHKKMRQATPKDGRKKNVPNKSPPRGDEKGTREEKRRVKNSCSLEQESPQPPLIPVELQTDEFLAAWRDWLQHRREIHKELKPTAKANLLRKLETWGPERSIAAIRHSIANGWQGLFEEDSKNAGKGTQNRDNTGRPGATGRGHL
jgi:hypothetical protein